VEPFLLIVLVAVGIGDALAATGIWMLFSSAASRPRLARAMGAIVGGVAGALFAEPQVAFVVQRLGYIQEAAGMKILFTFPFFLPLTTGLTAWLLSDMLGGRTRRPVRHALLSLIGAALGGALVLVPFFFMSPAPAWLSYPVLVGVPAVASTLAILLSARSAAPPNPALSLTGLRPAG